MLKTKINKIYIQEAFWLVLIVVAAWALMSHRPANETSSSSSGKVYSVRKSSVTP